MYSESKKLRLIESVKSIKSDRALKKLETFINNIHKQEKQSTVSARDLAGIWTEEDVNLIEGAIEKGCERIDLNDW